MYEGKLIAETLKMTYDAIDRTKPDRRTADRRQPCPLDARQGERRGSRVLNSTVRPAGGPNGRYQEPIAATHRLVIEGDKIRKERIPTDEANAHPEPWAKPCLPITWSPITWSEVPGTDEHELAALDHACENENRALKACCESAATEIVNDFSWWIYLQPEHQAQVAAIIYKHMRNGREL